MEQLVLASASPRRKEILEQVGATFTVCPSNAEEKMDTELSPALLVEELAVLKARDVLDSVDKSSLVIGADTVVSIGDRILGKPKDAEEAKTMLSELSGKTHTVYTGFCCIRKKDMKIFADYAKTDVTFRALSEEEIHAYIKTGEPMDKAGAYGIQEYGSLLIEGISGDYFNVVGLPINKLAQCLKREFNYDLLMRNQSEEK